MSIESWLVDRIPAVGRVALDVGANVGDYTQLLAGRFDEVHAFEPNPKVAAELAARCGSENVIVHSVAAGAKSGALTLNLYADTEHTSAYGDEHFARPTRGAALGTLNVTQVRLDSLRLRRVDFIKIDVEGAEHDVLKGAKRMLRACHPALLIEIHAALFGERCWRLLVGLGYESEVIPHPHTDMSNGHYWLHCKATPREVNR